MHEQDTTGNHPAPTIVRHDARGPLPSSSFPREGKGREGRKRVKVGVELDDDIVAWLATKHRRGAKVEIHNAALRAYMLLDATPEDRLRAQLDHKKREIARLSAEVRLLEVKLTDFDEDLNRLAAWRDDIALYLDGAPAQEAQRAWAQARGIPWPVYERLRGEVRRDR